MPTQRRKAGVSDAARPNHHTWPDVGRMSDARQRNKVVLPDPFPPRSATARPAAISRSICRRIVR
jgi:hypothetical protein